MLSITSAALNSQEELGRRWYSRRRDVPLLFTLAPLESGDFSSKVYGMLTLVSLHSDFNFQLLPLQPAPNSAQLLSFIGICEDRRNLIGYQVRIKKHCREAAFLMPARFSHLQHTLSIHTKYKVFSLTGSLQSIPSFLLLIIWRHNFISSEISFVNIILAFAFSLRLLPGYIGK